MTPELSIVIPCLNEEETLEKSIAMAKEFIDKTGITTEIIVADNGSTDQSVEIAKKMGVRIVQVPQKGYGSALRGGIEAAKSEYIIMGDADNSHDFTKILPFIEKLREGYDLVVGNRFEGGIAKGAMSFKNKYIGNPVLSFLGRLFFKTNIRDFHSGLRGFTKSAYKKMNLQTTGMEFASEMIVKASLLNLKTTEVPIVMHPDGRSRPPHLRPWRDGWRHLRFMLLYSPRWLFLFPGIVFFLIGFLGLAFFLFKTLSYQKIIYQSVPVFAGLALLGYQFIIFYALTKVYAVQQKLMPKTKTYDGFFKIFTLEKGILAGFLAVIAGVILYYIKLSNFVYNIFSILMILFGMQTILFGFFFSILGLKKA